MGFQVSIGMWRVWYGEVRGSGGEGERERRSINERFETYGAIYRTIAIQSEMEMYPGLLEIELHPRSDGSVGRIG